MSDVFDSIKKSDSDDKQYGDKFYFASYEGIKKLSHNELDELNFLKGKYEEKFVKKVEDEIKVNQKKATKHIGFFKLKRLKKRIDKFIEYSQRKEKTDRTLSEIKEEIRKIKDTSGHGANLFAFLDKQ